MMGMRMNEWGALVASKGLDSQKGRLPVHITFISQWLAAHVKAESAAPFHSGCMFKVSQPVYLVLRGHVEDRAFGLHVPGLRSQTARAPPVQTRLSLWQSPGAELEGGYCSFRVTHHVLPVAASRGRKHTWEHSVAVLFGSLG